MGIQIPQLQINSQPTVIDLVQQPSSMTIDGSVMDASLPLQYTPEANPGALPSGNRSTTGQVQIEGQAGNVDVQVLQRGDISYSVTGVRIDLLAT